MNDLIDRQELIDRLDDAYTFHEISRKEHDEIVSWLNNSPSVEPERKEGKWIRWANSYTPYKCSECGNEFGYALNFCGCCGAEMRGHGTNDK